MISDLEYNRQWNDKLFKNHLRGESKEKNAYIKFFSEIQHKLSGDNALDFSALNNLEGTKKNEPLEKKEVLKSDQLWVEGKRSSFALYLWDSKSDTNYYLTASYYSNSKYFNYSFSSTSKTMYALRYFNNYPVIVCLDDKIPKKYFIIDGNSFKHTNNINKAISQSVKNYYFFNDDITNTVIKKIEKQLAHDAKIKKYIIIGSVTIGVIILLVLIYIFVLKKKKTIVYDDDDDE
tara:strand:+ start:4389 stop:5090 length:702 start_codon:yes stop_codon:yes gene_type:complete